MSLDNLGQGGKHTVLPEDLQAHIENARNSVTHMEAEYTRLQKLAFNEKSTIETLHVEKVNLNKALEELKKKEEVAIQSLAEKSLTLKEIEDKIIVGQKRLDSVLNDADVSTKTITLKHAELDTREVSIKNREEDINDRLIKLVQKETDHQAKVDKLKRAIE